MSSEAALREPKAVSDEDVWAKYGYIVVAPTHRKRKLGRWETPQQHDGVLNLGLDLWAASNNPTKFYADRVYEVQAVLDHLETIIDDASAVTMVPGQARPFEPGTSRVALAGYSLGSTTTLVAAGQIVRAFGSVMDLTTHGLRRVNDNGPPGDVTDDSGPFVDVDAFLAMSLGGYAAPERRFEQ